VLLQRLGEESLYVPGAPGSGKSTFCRWLALLVAGGTLPDHPIPAPEGFRETLPDAVRARFPLLCRLREWAGREEGLSGKGHWTRAQLEESLSGWLDHTRPGGLTAAVFREELAEGRCLLILDGVDEVPETVLGAHLPRRNFITGLTDALPDWLERGNGVLLTSRPYGLRDDDRRRLGLTVAELAELPEELQHTFVRRLVRRGRPAQGQGKSRGAAATSCGTGRTSGTASKPDAAHRPLHHVGPGPEAAPGFLPTLRCPGGPGALQALPLPQRTIPGTVPAGSRRARHAPGHRRTQGHPRARSG